MMVSVQFHIAANLCQFMPKDRAQSQSGHFGEEQIPFSYGIWYWITQPTVYWLYLLCHACSHVTE